MKNNRSITLFLIAIMCFWTFDNSTSFAMNGLKDTEIEGEREVLILEEMLLISIDQESDIALYEDDELSGEFTLIPNQSKVTLIELVEEDFLFVNYKGKDVDGNVIDIEGYIDGSLITVEKYNDNDHTDGEEEGLDNSTEDEKSLPESDSEQQTEDEESEQQVDEAKEDIDENEELVDEKVGNSESVSETPNIKPMSSMINRVSYNGVALKNKTHVYSKQSRDSEVLKSYAVGSILKYSSLNGEWYQTGVFINGKKHIGYIHKSDVDNAIADQVSFQGVALNSPTHVFISASTSSKSLKSYKIGSILKYSTFSKDWYQTGVFINGKKHTGYIHKSHVDNAVGSSQSLQGIGIKSPTHIYTSASTSSKVLKSYKDGSNLKYSTFSKDWYRTGVFINGVKKTGYIHKSHVEEVTDNPQSQYGVALSTTTNVYTSASQSSKALKGYKQGSILKYSTFSKNWYQTGVYINGKRYTGYIHKSDVGTPPRQDQLQGIALKGSTNVYQDPFTSAKALKGYTKGHILKYRPYANGWYQTGVYINGKFTTGFIKTSDVDNIVSTPKSITGTGIKSPTYVYASPSKDSKGLKAYKVGSTLKYSTFTKEWYQTGVYINGVKHKGYIYHGDVSASNKKVVYLDAGHGGTDPGASGNGLIEKELNLDIAKRVQKLLESSGFIVIMSRISDATLSLSERTKKANDSNADIFVSVHINSFTNESASGIETWNMSEGPNPKESNILAKEIQKEIIQETKLNDRGVKDGNLHVNRESKMPSALVEVGFISNKGDAEKLKQSSFKNKAATGIANGIISYFRLVH